MKKTAFIFCLVISSHLFAQQAARTTEDFDNDWKFILDSVNDLSKADVNDDALWRTLNLPHDWSIELPFDSTSPTGNGGGALRGGMGWYRKTFSVPASSKSKNVFIDFDGIYMNSTVWLNGHELGFHPYGYTSFRYDLTPYLNFDKPNEILVKVDNLKQPNSRWYSGSGIYRNVWLVTTNKVYVNHWGTYIRTPKVSSSSADVILSLSIAGADDSNKKDLSITTIIYDKTGKEISVQKSSLTNNNIQQKFTISNPNLWSLENPYLYKAVTKIYSNNNLVDEYTTPFGIRYFSFDVDKGFSLNGKHFKINGVCDHHDLGCLGTAINTRALQRQLEILKSFGVNAIRTSHNPPAPELLQLCDEMGFIVMDEAFDMWKQPKNPYDYHLYWDEWHEKDLRSMVLRDRNHPSVFIWSIGNEIPEQWANKSDSGYAEAQKIALELSSIVKSLDTTRPVTSACNNTDPSNPFLTSGALDLDGFNYNQNAYPLFPQKFPGKKFLATETVSGIATRGHYDMPSDSIRRWPGDNWDTSVNKGNPDLTCSAYDNCAVPWGSTQEETWKIIKKYDFLSGQFIWTGFDYIGEPTPYLWPARSSYFGIVDLAGFPKDVYYMYQSEWTSKPVLHIFPHWNWKQGDSIDVWAYYNNADAVELFLNGKSLGKRSKHGDDLHVMWRVAFEPGTLKAISTNNGKIVLTQEIKTAGAPAKILLSADRNGITADGKDLSFVTITIVDKDGNMVPDADNLVQYKISGNGSIASLDNGSETDLESFKGTQHKTFNGLGLCVIQSTTTKGKIELQATTDRLQSASIVITTK